MVNSGRNIFLLLLIVVSAANCVVIKLPKSSELRTRTNKLPERKLLSFTTTIAKQQEYEKTVCELKSPKEA